MCEFLEWKRLAPYTTIPDIAVCYIFALGEAVGPISGIEPNSIKGRKGAPRRPWQWVTSGIAGREALSAGDEKFAPLFVG